MSYAEDLAAWRALGTPLAVRARADTNVHLTILATLDIPKPSARLGYVVAAARPQRKTVAEIQKVVAAHYGLTQMELISDRRARYVARPRQVAMWISRQITTRSMPDIGRRFGNRDHTTVLHALRRIEALRAEDPKMHDVTERLIEQLGGRPG